MQSVQAHLVQLNISWENRDANFQATADLLAHTHIRPYDLIVLPELFDSGFSLNISHTNDQDNATEHFLVHLSTDMRVYVAGGRTVRPQASPRALNMMTVYGPSGEKVADYAKIHPFTFGREPEAFDAGDTVVTFSWADSSGDTLRVCPAICYDLRFPELFRLGLRRGAEVFAIGANWPSARQEHWRTLLIARAIENQAFVLGANRTGNDPYLSYKGGSIAIDPKGRILGELADEIGVLSVPIDSALLHAWRREFPAWRDARLLEP